MHCPGCGYDAAPDFAFCPRCGRSLRAAAPVEAPADRRPVTVLFAGFTTLGERLDPEEIRALQGELFAEMAAAIERYDGFVEKFVGDAVMAVFGAPTAHEDDPERALHTALSMHERVITLNVRWERRLGAPLRLHVGVHTGPVVAGTLGQAAGSAYAVTGDTVNTAARLQGAAAPGQTLVSEATWALARQAFAFTALGDLALKGKAERIEVYELRGTVEARGARRGLEAHGLTAPLVGRDAQVAELLAAFERVATGRAEAVSLVGDVGAGKSRLLAELFARLEADGRLAGVTVRRAACSSLGERTYGVLGMFFREGFGIGAADSVQTARERVAAGLTAMGSPDDAAATILPVLPYVLGLEPEAPVTPDADPERLRRRIFLALRSLFELRLRTGPLVLVVEDLQWADAASVDLLRFMMERLGDRPLMLLVTHRPTFDAHAIVSPRAGHSTVRLGSLTGAESEAVLDGLFGDAAGALPDELRRLVVQRAGGNPFYLEEIVRDLIESGTLTREGDRWRCAVAAGALEVPATLQGLLLSRVDRLPPMARRLAQDASVLGLAFDLSLLRRLTAVPADCEAGLRELADTGLVEDVSTGGGTAPGAPTPDRRYRFTHGLVHEVIYQNLLMRRRGELHERAGRALESLMEHGERPRRLEDLEALGHHFVLSADRLKGARYLVIAGDWALGMYANADAVRNYERAIRTLRDAGAGDDECLPVEERLGDVLGLMGQREAALGRLGLVLETAETRDDRDTQARVHRKVAALHWQAGQRDPARRALERGLMLLEGQPGDHVELAHLYQEMGRLLFRSGDNQGAIAWAERALSHAGRLVGAAGPSGAADDRGVREAAAAMSHAYNTLGVALARVDRLDEAVRHIEQSVRVAEAHGLLQAACRGYANLSVLYSGVNPARAIETCRNGLDLATRIGDPAFQSRLYANLAVAYCALTNRCDDDGVAAAEAAIRLDRQLGELDHLAVPLIVLGQIYQCHGEPDRARRYYREALELAEEVGEPQLLFPCYDGLATLHLDEDDLAGAEAYMRQAREICERSGVEPDSLTVLPFLA